MSDQLVLRAGAFYRNPLGAELRAVEWIDSRAATRMLRAQHPVPSLKEGNPVAPHVMVLGPVWIMRDYDPVFGSQLHLATPEGLRECGYKLVDEGTAGE